MDRAVDRASTAPMSEARPGAPTGDPASEGERVRCCIAGCGPAGAMLGLLLARRGVDVLVLEKHGDFFRDFRGDTIHPSTLRIMDELGLADRLLRLPHTKAPVLTLQTPRGLVTLADFLLEGTLSCVRAPTAGARESRSAAASRAVGRRG